MPLLQVTSFAFNFTGTRYAIIGLLPLISHPYFNTQGYITVATDGSITSEVIVRPSSGALVISRSMNPRFLTTEFTP